MTKETKIDLKKQFYALEQKELNGWASFTAQTINDKNLEELSVIAELLNKVGVSLDITRKENEETGLSYDFVVLGINKEQYETAMGRNAGRKADFEQKYDRYGKCTVAELKEKLKTMKKTKIAEELGCSRMTLYRILCNIESRHPAEDTSIWHYTS